jgi:hypothetical protein
LQRLFNEGWRGLVTYSMDGTLREVPRIAKEVGFTKVIAGLFWFNNAQLAPARLRANHGLLSSGLEKPPDPKAGTTTG